MDPTDWGALEGKPPRAWCQTGRVNRTASQPNGRAESGGQGTGCVGDMICAQPRLGAGPGAARAVLWVLYLLMSGRTAW